MKTLFLIFLFLTGCAFTKSDSSSCLVLDNYLSFWSQQKKWKIKGFISVNNNDKVNFIWKHNQEENKLILINDFALLLAKIGWSTHAAWLKVNKDYYTANNLANILLINFNLKLGFKDPVDLLYNPKMIKNLKIMQKKCFSNYLLASNYKLKINHDSIYIQISGIEFD
jgi:outer membrane biogenesis lipoprotein LolB